MTTTLEELEKRLQILEMELAYMQERVGFPPLVSTKPGEWVPPILRDARAQQPAVSAAVAKAFEKMGITGEPVGIEKLHEMMIECGVNPEDNAFSREIIAMREERG